MSFFRLKNDLPIAESVLSQNRIRTYSDGVLTIQYVQPDDHGSYTCIISASDSSNVRSRPATITITCVCTSMMHDYRLTDLLLELDPPMPSRLRPSRNLTLIRGSAGLCPCSLDAYPPIQSVSWYHNGIGIRVESRSTFNRMNTVSLERSIAYIEHVHHRWTLLYQC
jgi:hypothetical protein